MSAIFVSNGNKPGLEGGKNMMSKPRPFTVWEMQGEFEVKNDQRGSQQGKKFDSLVFDETTGELTSMTAEQVAALFEEVEVVP